jgi:hypothetical protein
LMGSASFVPFLWEICRLRTTSTHFLQLSKPYSTRGLVFFNLRLHDHSFVKLPCFTYDILRDFIKLRAQTTIDVRVVWVPTSAPRNWNSGHEGVWAWILRCLRVGTGKTVK